MDATEYKSSPCKNCEHIYENKKTFLECVNCERRFGVKTNFIVHKDSTPTGICAWPHGCEFSVVSAKYCRKHKMVITSRSNYWKDKGLTEEEFNAKIFAPVNKRRGNPHAKTAKLKMKG